MQGKVGTLHPPAFSEILANAGGQTHSLMITLDIYCYNTAAFLHWAQVGGDLGKNKPSHPSPLRLVRCLQMLGGWVTLTSVFSKMLASAGGQTHSPMATSQVPQPD